MTKKPNQPTSQRRSRAALIAEKDQAIVYAAREHFLDHGFAGASMDAIAKQARVSVKTIYSHFANKDELFSKVMIGACTDNIVAGESLSEEALADRFGWFSRATQHGVFESGQEYLRHLLSEEQLSLYRVITRDADRLPELGQQYQLHIARGRTEILRTYLRSVARKKGWTGRDAAEDALTYEGLLRVRVFEEALHGLLKVTSSVIDRYSASASKTMWKVLTDGRTR